MLFNRLELGAIEHIADHNVISVISWCKVLVWGNVAEFLLSERSGFNEKKTRT